jgi:hypothetical protein
MANNNYSMIITHMTCYPQYQGQNNVVASVNWRYTATDGTYSALELGITDIPFQSNTPFVPYDQLTQDQVARWVKDTLGPGIMAKLQKSLDTSIEGQANPPLVTLRPTWNQ